MHLAFLGWGTAVPVGTLMQEEALELARSLCPRTEEQLNWLPKWYSQTGIKTRGIILGRPVLDDILQKKNETGSPFIPNGRPDDHGPTTRQRMEHFQRLGPPLALLASQQALENSNISAGNFSHLITVTCTGFFSPGFDYNLIQNLSLSPSVSRTQIGFMGCHGSLNGLRVAHAYVKAQPDSKVLLSSLELCSTHFHYGWDPQKIIANALFSDGAASVVLGASGNASNDVWKLASSGSCILPDSKDAMTWNIGDHGFEMTLAKQVPGLIKKYLKPWLEQWLSKNNLMLSDIKSWALHPGGPRILTAIEDALSLPAQSSEISRKILSKHGNMSSATLLFILKKMAETNSPRPCVALGFGPGLAAEAALFI